MTKVKEQAIGLLQSMPDNKVIYILDILRGLKGLAESEPDNWSSIWLPRFTFMRMELSISRR